MKKIKSMNKKNKSGVCINCGKPSGDYYICNDCVKKIPDIKNDKESYEKSITRKVEA